MKNYYQLLELPVNASEREIAAVIGVRWAQCEKLRRNPDPAVASRAEKYQELLTEIQNQLLDPDCRQIYDQSIGLGRTQPVAISLPQIPEIAPAPPRIEETFEEPMEPQASEPAENQPAKAGTMVEFVPSQAQLAVSPQQETALANPWECPKCHTDNLSLSLHCMRCGNQIGKSCPTCQTVLVLSALFCTSCGANIQAIEAKRLADQRRIENKTRIFELGRLIDEEKFNLENWKDAVAGCLTDTTTAVGREYARILASNSKPNLWWLWIILAVCVGIFCGLVLQIPKEITMYVGLALALPAGISTLRFGGGCYAALAVTAVGGSIAAAIFAWGSQFAIGIICGLLSLLIIYFIGDAILDSNVKTAVQAAAQQHYDETAARIRAYEQELENLS